jgi:hypothetical protein
MGNITAKVVSIPQKIESVTISTRSDPPHGYRVVQEKGLILANSSSFPYNSKTKERACMMEAMNMAQEECVRLGGNYILGTHFEIKQFGESGTRMCYSLTGTACVVKSGDGTY